MDFRPNSSSDPALPGHLPPGGRISVRSPSHFLQLQRLIRIPGGSDGRCRAGGSFGGAVRPPREGWPYETANNLQPSTPQSASLTATCGWPGRGSDSPLDCHSLPRLRFAYPSRGALKKHRPFGRCFGFWKNYLAYSTALVSRMTLTLIWPGYSSSCSIFLAMSRARRIMLSSVTTSGLTMMRISRPAWMA